MQVSPNGLLDKLGMSDMMLPAIPIYGFKCYDQWSSVVFFTRIEKASRWWISAVEGKWPTNYNEVVLEVDENNEITDYGLYSLGLLDQDELVKNYQKILKWRDGQDKTQI